MLYLYKGSKYSSKNWKCSLFYSCNNPSITIFLATMKLAYGTSRTHTNEAMWVFLFFVKSTLAAKHYCQRLISSTITAVVLSMIIVEPKTEKKHPSLNTKVVICLLKTTANYQVTAIINVSILYSIHQADLKLMQNADSTYKKPWKVEGVYEELTLTTFLFKEPMFHLPQPRRVLDRALPLQTLSKLSWTRRCC